MITAHHGTRVASAVAAILFALAACPARLPAQCVDYGD